MTSIVLGKNKEVILRLNRSTPQEWNAEVNNFIRENYRTFYDVLEETVHPRTKIKCDAKRAKDYLEGTDAAVSYDRLYSVQHYVYEHYKTGEIRDTSVPGCRAPASYTEVADRVGVCSPVKPWFCKEIKRVVFTKPVEEKIPFFLSPKRTRFYSSSSVDDEDQFRVPTNHLHRCNGGIPETVVDAVDETLFAHIDTQAGGKEFERLASFRVGI